jgi:membrane fusion protein, multidrug efflux system
VTPAAWGIINRMRVYWLAIPLLVACAAGCTEETKAAQDKQVAASPAPPRQVKVLEAVEQRVARTVVATGTLGAEDQVVVGTKVPGRLADISIDMGTRVRRGQVVARLDAGDYRMRVEQAEAALQQARARLGLTATGTDERVNAEQTSIVRQARAVLEEAQLTRDRSAKLMEQDLIARSQLDTAEANLKVAEGRYHDALEEVRNRQALLAQRRSEVDLARQQLADTAMISPIDGAVAIKQASVGEYLGAGAPVATVVQTHPLRLRVNVPERDAVDVRIGQSVRLTVEGDATVYQGRVVRLSPIVQEQNRTLSVEAEVPNERAVLKPGAFARADIVTQASDPVIRVPTTALVIFAGIEKVLVVRQGKIVEVRVQTGRRANESVEIVSGLKPGEQVVLQPGNLAPGQAVVVAR